MGDGEGVGVGVSVGEGVGVGVAVGVGEGVGEGVGVGEGRLSWSSSSSSLRFLRAALTSFILASRNVEKNVESSRISIIMETVLFFTLQPLFLEKLFPFKSIMKESSILTLPQFLEKLG